LTTVATIGTLAPSGFFTPGDVKNEAELLHTATLAVGRDLLFRIEAASQDLLAAWNAFVSDEKDFYGRSQSFFYFLDFADNATRDQVLALETRFNDLKSQIGKLQADASSGDTSATIEAEPAFSDPTTRQVHSVLTEKGGPVSEATGAVGKAIDKVTSTATSIGWQTIAAALLVIGAVGTVAVMVAKSGAIKVAV
jgi:hypothetical protein